MSALDVALVGLALTFLATVWRTAVGPTEADRAVAADLAYYVVVAGIAVLGIRLGEPALLDVVLVATLVGFVTSVTLAHLVDRGDRTLPNLTDLGTAERGGEQR